MDTNQRLNSNERSILQLRKTVMTMSEEHRKMRRYFQRQKSILLPVKTTTINSTDISPDVCRNEKPPIYINNTVHGNTGGGDSGASVGGSAATVALIASWVSWPGFLRTVLFAVGCISLYNIFYMSAVTVTDTVTNTVTTPVYSMYNTVRDAISASVLLRGANDRDIPGVSEFG